MCVLHACSHSLLVDNPNNNYFELFIYAVIIANIVVIILENSSSSSNSAYDLCNKIFTAIFISEMVLKIYALGIFGTERTRAFCGSPLTPRRLCNMQDTSTTRSTPLTECWSS